MSTQEHEAAAEKIADEAVTWTAGYRNYSRTLLVKLIAAALADAVREARKIAGCVSCEDHAALICNPCAAKQKADAVRVARASEGDATAKPVPGGLAHSRQCPSFVGGACLCNLNKSWGEGDATPGPEPVKCLQCGDVESALAHRGTQSHRFAWSRATPPKKGRE